MVKDEWDRGRCKPNNSIEMDTPSGPIYKKQLTF